jgi:hypothetical protein
LALTFQILGFKVDECLNRIIRSIKVNPTSNTKEYNYKNQIIPQLTHYWGEKSALEKIYFKNLEFPDSF